jgi:hypothetical protein
MHASSNFLSLRISARPFFGSHFRGTLVNLGREAFGQFLQPIFLLTLQFGYGHRIPLSGVILPLPLSPAD